jgi:hypothetical protein
MITVSSDHGLEVAIRNSVGKILRLELVVMHDTATGSVAGLHAASSPVPSSQQGMFLMLLSLVILFDHGSCSVKCLQLF